MRCAKYGSKIFLVDETVTHVEVDDEIVKTYSGDLTNANFVRCTYPKIYSEYHELDMD